MTSRHGSHFFWLVVGAALTAFVDTHVVLSSQPDAVLHGVPQKLPTTAEEQHERRVFVEGSHVQSDPEIHDGYLPINKPLHSVHKCVADKVQKYSYQGDLNKTIANSFRGRHLALCKNRHRRHKAVTLSRQSSVNKYDSPQLTDSQGTDKFMSTFISSKDEGNLALPKAESRCMTVAMFLANRTNLLYVETVARDNDCESDSTRQIFSTLRETDGRELVRLTHRSRTMRRWRHLSCKLFRELVVCINSKRSTTTTPATTTHTVTDDVNTETEKSHDKDHVTTPQNEAAVHVSDSSHVDFLHFMIGDEKDWSDNYEFWFY